MRAIRRPENNTSIKFDFTAPILPLIGLGGLSFNQTINDFQDALIERRFNNNSQDNFDYLLDKEFFSLTIRTKNNEIEIVLDLFTGKINSFACEKGYLGKLDNNIGIGSSIKTALAKDEKFGFNLDTEWFVRHPFDGLIIYPPIDLKDNCFEAALYGTEYPDFDIRRIELLDLLFAKKHFDDKLWFQTNENGS